MIPIAVLGLAAHDYFLMPENFFLHKGDKLDVHLITGDQFTKLEEIKYLPSKTTKFMLYDGSKKVDLTKVAKDSAAPVIDYTMENTGQVLLEMNRGYEFKQVSRDTYAEFLSNEGFDKLSEKVKSANQFRIREKYTSYLKTLISVDDHDGNAYEKVLNDDFEIILKDNPYKKKYGDDMTMQLKYKGKPAAAAQVTLYIRTTAANVYPQKLITGKNGEATFTMTREGVYMLRSVFVMPTSDKDADYESWLTSYTFSFSSTDEMPNTYKEFGFGNKH